MEGARGQERNTEEKVKEEKREGEDDRGNVSEKRRERERVRMS